MDNLEYYEGYLSDGKKYEEKLLEIPYNIKIIGNGAFWGNKYIEVLYIDDNVEKIEESAFKSMKELKMIHIGKNVSIIENDILNICDNLEVIDVDPENSYFDSRDNCNAIIRKEDNCLIQGCKSSFIPDSVLKIGENAFRNCNIEHIIFPNGLKEIGTYSFCMTKLSEVVIPNSVEIIKERAFNELLGQNRENKLVLSNNIKHIEGYAFCGFGTTDLDIPEGIDTIGDSAFLNSKIIRLRIPKNLKFIASNAFKGCNNLKIVELPKNSPFKNMFLSIPNIRIDEY